MRNYMHGMTPNPNDNPPECPLLDTPRDIKIIDAPKLGITLRGLADEYGNRIDDIDL